MFQYKIITCISAVVAAIFAVGMNYLTGESDASAQDPPTDDFFVESCETVFETFETDEVYFVDETDEVLGESNPETIAETEIIEETDVTEIEDVTETDVLELEMDALETEIIAVQPSYSEYELDLLARLMTAEMGAYWMPDEAQLYVGSVVLNRVNHESFPNTIYDVIYQAGQYGPVSNGTIYNSPDERAVKNARFLLENGSILPENVVFQAEFVQGDGVYCQYYDWVLCTTTYFCYALN